MISKDDIDAMSDDECACCDGTGMCWACGGDETAIDECDDCGGSGDCPDCGGTGLDDD